MLDQDTKNEYTDILKRLRSKDEDEVLKMSGAEAIAMAEMIELLLEQLDSIEQAYQQSLIQRTFERDEAVIERDAYKAAYKKLFGYSDAMG